MNNISWVAGTSLPAAYAQFEQTVRDVANYINSVLARPINFDVSLGVAPLGGALAVGTSDVSWVGDDTFEPLGLIESRTGGELAGFDAIITFDVSSFHYFEFDNATDFAGKADAFKIILHEITHGLGFNGWTDWESGSNPYDYSQPFDEHIILLGGRPFFTGLNVGALTGGPVELQSGNLFHLNTNVYPNDVMNSQGGQTGSPLAFSKIDLAILADLGYGTIQNDILVNRSDAENVHGGEGLDQFLFAGARSGYQISSNSADDVSVTKGGVSDNLASIERLVFADGTLAFDDDGTAGQSYRIYQAAFARTPDNDGLEFWIGQMDDGMDLQEVSRRFVDSAEFRALYASNSTEEYVDALYQNVLGRDGEIAGMEFWVDEISSGRRDQAKALADFSESAENVMGVGPAINDGIWYS